MSKFKTKINRKGMTLVEVIIAIGLFGIVGVILLSTFSVCMRVVVRSGNKEKAIVAASSAIDESRTKDSAAAEPAAIVNENNVIIEIFYGDSASGTPDDTMLGKTFDSKIDGAADGQKSILKGFGRR